MIVALALLVTNAAELVLTAPIVYALEVRLLVSAVDNEVDVGGTTIVVDPGMMLDTPEPEGTEGRYSEIGKE